MNHRHSIRVLYLDHVPRLSGAEQSLLDLVSGLAKGPVEPIVVLPGDGPLATKLRAEGVLVRMVPMSRRMLETSRRTLRARPLLILARLWAFLVASWRIYRIVREMRPQIIHTNTLKTHLLAVLPARIARVPLVWHVRDILPRGWLRRAFVFCARVPALIIVPSRSVAKGFGKRNKKIHKKLRLIPNGVRIDEIVADSAAGKALRQEVGVNGGTLVGIVGRIAPWKGQETFIRAAAMLAERHPKARFAVIGAVLFPENDLPFQQRLQDLVAEAGLSDRIVFLGWRTPAEAMGALDVLVHASTEPEPFGRAVIEAMAAGLPVIASNSGAMREILPPTAGMLVKAGRPEILADSLDMLLSDRRMRTEMGAAGQKIAHEFFDVRRTVAGVGAMYGELARKQRWRPMRESKGRLRMRNRPIAWPAEEAAPVAPSAALAAPGNGNGDHGAGGEEQGAGSRKGGGSRRERRSDVRRLVARIPSPERPSEVRPHVAPRRPAAEPDRSQPAIAARADSPKTVTPAARAVPAMKPKAPPRRMPDTSPEVPEPAAPMRREAPVPAERAARAVPMRFVPSPQIEEAPVEEAPPLRAIPFQIAPKRGYEIAKRMLDVAIASAVLVIGAPLWLLVAIAIKLDSRGPALFRNTVVGRDAVPFTYFKFRSMRVDMTDDEHRAFIERYVREDGGHEENGEKVYKLTGDCRVTGVGRWIRKFSIDEVPQLINVLRGEMSIVGPRPPLVYEYELYDGNAKQRLVVPPGLTGLQQVEARHTASFRDKIDMDLDYIRRRSFWLDITIMLKSVPVAFKGE